MVFNRCVSGFAAAVYVKNALFAGEVNDSLISPGKWKSLSDYTILITGGKGGSGDFAHRDSKQKKKKIFQPLQKLS